MGEEKRGSFQHVDTTYGLEASISLLFQRLTYLVRLKKV